MSSGGSNENADWVAVEERGLVCCMQGVKDTEGGRVRIWVLENGDKGFLGFGREVRDVVIRVLQAPIFWGWERFCWVQVIEGGRMVCFRHITTQQKY